MCRVKVFFTRGITGSNKLFQGVLHFVAGYYNQLYLKAQEFLLILIWTLANQLRSDKTIWVVCIHTHKKVTRKMHGEGERSELP